MTETELAGVIPPTEAMIAMVVCPKVAYCSVRRYSRNGDQINWYEDWCMERGIGGNVVECIQSIWGK